MKKSLTKLATLGGSPLCEQPPASEQFTQAFGPKVAEQLATLLAAKNGFYAFEQALHIFPDQRRQGEHGLFAWNAADLWRSDYDGLANGIVCFAEDVFGGQFCFYEGMVATFDPETGKVEAVADNLEAWANLVLQDYKFWTGAELAHAWQERSGRLPFGSRLVPKVPFVLGGEYETSNLHCLEDVKGMRWRASIATQIRDLPDGSSVELKVID